MVGTEGGKRRRGEEEKGLRASRWKGEQKLKINQLPICKSYLKIRINHLNI
jgi:hypothetical protein